MPTEVSLLTAVRWPTFQPERVRSRPVRYRGFSIVARPYRLSGSGLWTVEVEINRHALHRSFSEATRYQTEEEARDHSLELGRHIIDGRIQGWSTSRLHSIWKRFTAARGARIVLVGVVALLLLAGVGDRNHRLAHRATQLAGKIYSATASRIVTMGQNLYASIATGP